MVRRKDGEVAGFESGAKIGQPAVEFFQRAGVAFHVVPMAVLLIEIDQVDEDEPPSMWPMASRVFAIPSALLLVFT